jgi:hypothetical protein
MATYAAIKMAATTTPTRNGMTAHPPLELE